MTEFCLITFENTTTAIKAEGYLKGKAVNLMIMPTPTYITKSCGISIRVKPEEEETVKDILKEGQVQFKSYYKKEGNSYIQLL